MQLFKRSFMMIIITKIRNTVFLLLTCLMLFLSCTKENDPPVQPTAAKITGTIQGWDDKTNSADASGVSVKITNLTGLTSETLTDAAGKYSFDNIPFDSYDMVITKTGHGTYKVFGITHVYSSGSSFTTVPNISFGKTSTTTVTALSVSGNTINGLPGVTFDYATSPLPSTSGRVFIRYFLSSSPDVSEVNYTAYSPVFNFTNLSNITGFSSNDLIGMGFSVGQRVYAKMYGDSFIANDYVDPNTGKRVFPNINTTAAPAVSFVVP